MHCGTALTGGLAETGLPGPDEGQAGQPPTARSGPELPAARHELRPQTERREEAVGQQGRTSWPGNSAGLEGERRVVTILFCDVQGSTALAEVLDPEEWADIMNEGFGYLIRPVYRYAGTVARLMGDAILAFFGAPVAYEDDPQRAILAGLEIVSGIRDFRERVKRQRGLEFDVRVGIHTGLVVVGEIGNDLAMEYTAMGDAVNLAARVEQAADPGSVLITEDTYRLAAALFEVEALGVLEVRGKRQAVQAYRVLGLKDNPDRLRGVSGLNAALVGREPEMRQLRQAAAQVREGEGRIVCLTGEAGLGKSRLIEELRQEWIAANTTGFNTWRESRLVTHTAAQPYAAFQALIRGLCAVNPGDSPDIIHEKLVCGCLPTLSSPDQCTRVSRAFEVLLGQQSPQGAFPLEGEVFRRELFEAMLTTWEEWALLAPTVLVFDDLHWADPASVELLMDLYQLAERAPVLFLCALRPERFSPAWSMKSAVQQEYPERFIEVELIPLTEVDTEQLASSLLELNLPEDMLQVILNKSEGNPFFVEEVVRTLIECGAIVREEPGESSAAGAGRWRVEQKIREITLPDNVQSLVMARIDRLNEADRYVLQIAAVIGRTFNRRVLERILAGALQLDQQLQALEKADLILESASFTEASFPETPSSEGRPSEARPSEARPSEARAPEVEYTFRHALTHETVYSSILLKRRKFFHLLVGEALEALYSGRSDEFAALLAHHFDEGGDPRAIDYYIQAADRAFRLYAMAEAIAYATQALELGEKHPEHELPYANLYLQRGRALELSNRYRQALANYAEFEALARQREDRELLLSALTANAILRATPTPVQDAVLARQLCEQALDLAWEINDQAAAAKIMWALLLVNVRGGRTEEAVLFGERALSLARDLNLKELLGLTLNDISQAYMAVGQIRRGRETLEEAQKILEELNNQPMLADALATAALFDFFMGEYQRSIYNSEEALKIGRRIGNLWSQAYALMYMGNVYHEFGENGQAIRVMNECLRLSEQAQFVAPLVNTRAELGKIYASMGLLERGRELVRKATDIAGQYTPPWFPWVLTEQAQLHILAGEFPEAELELDRSRRAIQSGDPIGFTAAVIPLVRSQLALAQKDYPRVLAEAAELERYRALGIRTYMPDLDYRRGKALFGLGRVEEAREALSTARQEAEELGSRRILWPILKALGEVERARGELESASRHWQASAEIVEFIAGRIDDEELKTAFLGLPEVQEVYQELETANRLNSKNE
jgi:predicted ATPase/class 3 adenylate cyclase